MSSMQNKELARRFIDEVFNRGNLSAVDQFVGPSYISHEPVVGEKQGSEGVRQLAQTLRTAFPDLHSTLNPMIAEGDLVAFHATITGTQQGEFLGVPPSGKRVSWSADVFFRIANGKIVERWGSHNLLEALQQMGATMQVATPAGR